MLKKNIQLLLITLIIAMSVLTAHSQSNKEQAIYDSITYHYYLQGTWDSVIDIGKEALYKGYDFYFLRMRMGLAYDYQGNFRMAERQYEKALEFKPIDVSAAYYFYFAAINGGRKGVAFSKFNHFDSEQKKYINPNKNNNLDYLYDSQKIKTVNQIKVGALDFVSLSYGSAFTNNKSHKDDLYPNEQSNLFSTGYIRNKQSYLNFSLKGNISPLIQWDFSYNNHQIDGLSILQLRGEKAEWKPTNVSQNEIFGALGFLFGNGWNLKTHAHYLGYKGTATEFSLDTIIYVLPMEQDTLLDEQASFNSVNYSYTGNDYLIGMSLNKKVGLVDFSVFATYGRIGNQNPIQIGGEFSILPKGNYSLYLTNKLFYYSDDVSNRFIYKVSAGGFLSKKWSLDASATFGNLQYTNESTIAVVYNWSEKTTFKGDLVLTYQISPKVYFSLRYQMTQKQSIYSSFQVDGTEKSIIYPGFSYLTYGEVEDYYQFNQHFIIGSLSWYLH